MKISAYLMTTADVARALGVGTNHVRNLDGVLKPERLGNGQRRYRPEDIEAYAAVRARRRWYGRPHPWIGKRRGVQP